MDYFFFVKCTYIEIMFTYVSLDTCFIQSTNHTVDDVNWVKHILYDKCIL